MPHCTRRALFFRSELLPLSETFILGQANAFQRFDAWFTGLKRIPNSLELDKSRITLATHSNTLQDKIVRRLYMRTGVGPHFLKQIAETKPVILHAHFATDGCAALPIKKHLDLPLVVTLYGYDVTSSDAALRRSPIGRTYLQRRTQLWEKASLFICISEFIRQRALRLGYPEDKLWVNPLGLDVQFFQPSAMHTKQPIVLFVGRLVEKKGCIYLIRAMAEVEKNFPVAKLVVLGDGPLRTSLEEQAQSTMRNYEFLGAQPAAAVQHWMQRACVVAAPSVVASNGDSEGLCVVACEAQAMGVPVVSFHGPGLSEAVADGETGFLVEQRNEHALAEAILSLLKDEALSARMGAAGRKRVETHFNVLRQAEKIEDQYEKILSGR
jgi:glycosyltransferase involved in cell wall biosynthesis